MKKYIHFIGKILLLSIFCFSLYYLVINVFHEKSMNKEIYVSENDTYYKKFYNNVNAIKNNIDNYSYNKKIHKIDYNTMNNFYNKIDYCYTILNNDIELLQENKFLKYYDVYSLNEYFVNNFVNKCFTLNLSWINNISNSYLKEQYTNAKFSIDIITNNSLYLKNELKDNSSYYYNTNYFNEKIRNNLESSYQLILHNYSDFSNIILNLSSYLTRGDRND